MYGFPPWYGVPYMAPPNETKSTRYEDPFRIQKKFERWLDHVEKVKEEKKKKHEEKSEKKNSLNVLDRFVLLCLLSLPVGFLYSMAMITMAKHISEMVK